MSAGSPGGDGQGARTQRHAGLAAATLSAGRWMVAAVVLLRAASVAAAPSCVRLHVDSPEYVVDGPAPKLPLHATIRNDCDQAINLIGRWVEHINIVRASEIEWERERRHASAFASELNEQVTLHRGQEISRTILVEEDRVFRDEASVVLVDLRGFNRYSPGFVSELLESNDLRFDWRALPRVKPPAPTVVQWVPPDLRTSCGLLRMGGPPDLPEGSASVTVWVTVVNVCEWPIQVDTTSGRLRGALVGFACAADSANAPVWRVYQSPGAGSDKPGEPMELPPGKSVTRMLVWPIPALLVGHAIELWAEYEDVEGPNPQRPVRLVTGRHRVGVRGTP